MVVLWLHVILKFKIYAAHCCTAATSSRRRARSRVYESYDAVRPRKARCEAVPDNPKTGDTYQTHITVEEEAALAFWGGRGLRARNK